MSLEDKNAVIYGGGDSTGGVQPANARVAASNIQSFAEEAK